MEFQELFSRLNDGKLAEPHDKHKWKEASDRISVHAKGIRPRFENPRKKGLYGAVVTPANYDEKYQYLFDNYILNRHPNEQEEHYQFRLSVYPCITEQIYLEAKAQVSGSIFQQSQYTISANEERGQAYLDLIRFDKRLRSEFLEHVLTDPYGKFAVVETHLTEFGTDEPALPNIELVESCHILHFEKGESILFKSDTKVDGKHIYYFLDRTFCVKMIRPDGRRKQYDILASYQHDLGVLPVVDNNTNFFKPFVSWADQIARNFSDDEVVAKNNNHPHIQMVESVCHECLGQRVKDYECVTCESGVQEENCRTCKGRGTISVNPGEIHVIKENDFRPGELTSGSGMIDRVKFINPDVAISQNSFDRAWRIYEQGLKSLHLKYVDASQSGVAKAIDREQLYLLISGVSEHMFDIADALLTLLFGYLDLGISTQKPYIVERPTQFQIKTEADVQAELKELDGQDISVRRQKTEEYTQVVYSGNKVELKKLAITKVWDVLYAMKADEISSYKLMNGVTERDIVRHVRSGNIMDTLILERGSDWFLNASTAEIMNIMDGVAEQYYPKSAIVVNPVE